MLFCIPKGKKLARTVCFFTMFGNNKFRRSSHVYIVYLFIYLFINSFKGLMLDWIRVLLGFESWVLFGFFLCFSINWFMVPKQTNRPSALIRLYRLPTSHSLQPWSPFARWFTVGLGQFIHDWDVTRYAALKKERCHCYTPFRSRGRLRNGPNSE